MDGRSYWIRLTDKNIGREFIWMSTVGTANYTNWGEDQPRGISYDLHLDELTLADCVHLNTDGKTWSDTSCNMLSMHVFCQKGK